MSGLRWGRLFLETPMCSVYSATMHAKVHWNRVAPSIVSVSAALCMKLGAKSGIRVPLPAFSGRRSPTSPRFPLALGSLEGRASGLEAWWGARFFLQAADDIPEAADDLSSAWFCYDTLLEVDPAFTGLLIELPTERLLKPN